MSFAIRILNHRWVNKIDTHLDPCSHGTIDLHIGGIAISDKTKGDWVTSIAALRMLRGIQSNQLVTDEDHHWTQVIPRCGAMIGSSVPVTIIGCPVGINWSVVHQGDRVRIFDVKASFSTAADAVEHFETEALLPLCEYAMQVLAFAQSVKRFFAESKPKDLEPEEQASSEAFWIEFDELLNAADLVTKS